MKKQKLIFERILPIALIVVYAIRLFCYQTTIREHIGLASSPYPAFLTVLALVAIWLQYTGTLIVAMRPFFHFKTLQNLTRFVTPVIFVLNLALLKPIVTLLCDNSGWWILMIALALEAVLGLVISLYYGIKDRGNKVNYKNILFTLGIFLLMMVASMPGYFPQFTFGFVRMQLLIKELNFEHRLFLYFGLILVPFLLYFRLRNKSEDVIRFALIYICLAVLTNFLVNYSYLTFIEPWSWPFHLCNTALFILPICLIFKTRRLFYFTYFINVMGALLAMLMPNYDIDTNIMSLRIFTFWYNHWVAFFMPVLAVALKLFKRPTIKEFYYSMCWFFAYFILALVMNVIFSSMGHDVDYFFINSDYIADKLGQWAENLFNMNWTLTINGMDFVFHPIYQILFFITYVGIGFGVWFVYTEFFRIADNHYALEVRLHEIKIHEYAYQASLSPEKRERMLENNMETKLELKHFSKKYGNNKNYAVEDANLVVNGGEIFGFLGPNGAGKSTIIKSIVGIQPISEGSIEVCGYDVATQPTYAKYNIGYVPDHYALYEKLTGREYINYIADIFDVNIEERNERMEKYVNLFELQHAIDSKIGTYSHGMKQKITIMAALIHNPKIWILDEPLTGLDPNSIFQVKECMRQHAAEGNIVFFSSHIIDIVEKLCARIAIIKHGHIEYIKSVQEIEDSGNTLEQFYLNTVGNNEEDF